MPPAASTLTRSPVDLWTIRFAERLRFPRVAAQHGEMLAIAHNSTGPTSAVVDSDSLKSVTHVPGTKCYPSNRLHTRRAAVGG